MKQTKWHRILCRSSLAAAMAFSAAPAVQTFAEETEETETPETEEVILEEAESGETVITGFEPVANNYQVSDEAMSEEEMKAVMPERVTAILSDGRKIPVSVSWNCTDSSGKQFDFEAEISGEYTVAEGVELPMFYIRIGRLYDGEIGPLMKDTHQDAAVPDYSDLQTAAATDSFYRNTSLPKVRNQSPYGTCWAFATIGAVEGDLIKDGAADKSVDLSELQLAYFVTHGYTDPKNNHAGDSVSFYLSERVKTYLDIGGGDDLVTRSLSNMVGLVNETDVPYSKGHTFVPDMKYAVSSDVVQVTGGYYINPGDSIGIKRGVLEHGGVSTTMAVVEKPITVEGVTYEARYNETTNAYYGNCPYTNHQIMIVGWDDNFSRTKFAQGLRPEHDGAWLIRNSWGSRGDENNMEGYFWISYEDAAIRKSSKVAYDADTNPHDYCYSYASAAEMGEEVSAGQSGTVSETYRISGNEIIDAVGVEFKGADVDLQVQVTDGTTTVSGKLHAVYEGFYTIKLDTPLKTVKDTDVTVTVSAECSTAEVLFILERTGKADLQNLRYTAARSGPGCVVNGERKDADAVLRVYTRKAPESDQYRMYNPNTGEHFYTGNSEEKEVLTKAGWKFEGTAFSTLQSGGLPVYRLYNSNAGDHHYTISKEEAESLTKAGWKDEGVAFYASADGTAQYRLYNPNAEAGAHFYTSDQKERDSLIKAGWKFEGIAFYTEE